jgi:hypothetical protein
VSLTAIATDRSLLVLAFATLPVMSDRKNQPTALRNLRARVRPLKQPIVWGSLVVLGFLSVFTWEFSYHPERFFNIEITNEAPPDSTENPEGSVIVENPQGSQRLPEASVREQEPATQNAEVETQRATQSPGSDTELDTLIAPEGITFNTQNIKPKVPESRKQEEPKTVEVPRQPQPGQGVGTTNNFGNLNGDLNNGLGSLQPGTIANNGANNNGLTGDAVFGVNGSNGNSGDRANSVTMSALEAAIARQYASTNPSNVSNPNNAGNNDNSSADRPQTGASTSSSAIDSFADEPILRVLQPQSSPANPSTAIANPNPSNFNPRQPNAATATDTGKTPNLATPTYGVPRLPGQIDFATPNANPNITGVTNPTPNLPGQIVPDTPTNAYQYLMQNNLTPNAIADPGSPPIANPTTPQTSPTLPDNFYGSDRPNSSIPGYSNPTPSQGFAGSTSNNPTPTNPYNLSPNGSNPTIQPIQPPQPYSVPRPIPGRYIGGGEINTFSNP